MNCISDANEDSLEIPTNCVVADNIIDTVFDDLTSDIAKGIILTPKNDASLLLNKQVLDRLPGEQHIYLSVDQAICDNRGATKLSPREFINSLTPSGMPEHRLCLKVGSIIVLLRNLDIQGGICNGTRLTIKLLYENIIVAETIFVNKKTILIPRIKLAPSDANLLFVFQRRQFPVRLAYSMTIKLIRHRVRLLINFVYISLHQCSVIDSYMSHFQELSHLKTSMLTFVKQLHRAEETRNI